MRIGQGFDTHRFEKGRPLILGGIEIPYEYGLKAHSDGDVVIHAVCDALLGALALGDIGQHFPDTDATYKNIDSTLLLKQVKALVVAEGYTISNIDCTVIAEKPKLKPHIERMRENLAQHLSIAVKQISIKATTAEQMGALGRQEGMACSAVCLVM